jgi:hypothetical protein
MAEPKIPMPLEQTAEDRLRDAANREQRKLDAGDWCSGVRISPSDVFAVLSELDRLRRRLTEEKKRLVKAEAALRECVLKRRKDQPGADPTWRDAEMQDEDITGYIARADGAARRALAHVPEQPKP